jgi:hypothetical protein
VFKPLANKSDSSFCTNRLGSDFAHPQQELANQNVEARWQKAAQTAAVLQRAQDGEGSRPASPDIDAGGISGQQITSPGRHRKRRGDDGEMHVRSNAKMPRWLYVALLGSELFRLKS